MDKETYIIAGLGNPGAQYAHTRHNVGFEVTDELCRRFGAVLNKKMCKGILCEVQFQPDCRVVICQPQTFMNLSGECVAELQSWYKCPSDHIIVIYDDIDLPEGKLRIRKNGSAGTHNGMRSVVSCLGAMDFPRIRVGTGAKPEGWELADWVLSSYRTPDEKRAMAEAFSLAADCAEDIIVRGIDHAMQEYNGKGGIGAK